MMDHKVGRKMKKLSLAFWVGVIAGLMPVDAATVNDFEKKFTVTVPEGLVDGQLENFPLLVRLGAGISGFSYSVFKQDGADILVTDSNGEALPFELENWNPSGESRLWVQVPTVSEGTVIHVYYGSDAEVSQVSGMWDGYVGVWHLNESGDGEVAVGDSSGNQLLGECHSSSKAVTDGKLGGARFVTTDTSNNPGKDSGITVDLSEAAKRAAADSLAPAFTASFYFRPQKDTANWEYLISRKDTDSTKAWGVQFGDEAGADFNRIRVYGGGTDYSTDVVDGQADYRGNILVPNGGKGQWHKLDCVWSEDATYALYFDGALVASGILSGSLCAANGSCNLSIGGALKPDNGAKGGRGFYGDMDEVRLMASSASASRIAAEWRQESGAVGLVYGEVRNVDQGAPVLSVPSAVRNDDGSFTFSVVVSENDASPGSVKCVVTGSEYPMASADDALPKTYSVAIPLQELPENSTMTYFVKVKSNAGDDMVVDGGAAFYTGSLTIGKLSDADENGAAPGAFLISRDDTSHDLAVNLSLGGTAVEGIAYHSMPHPVTIPAGQTQVEVKIVPIYAPEVQEDTVVEITLSDGLYGIASGAISVGISNIVLNAWTAAAPGLASDAGNWYLGRIPLSSDHVLFDGRFSQHDCEWDSSAPHEVAGWMQNNSFTGTVTVCTMFPAKADANCFTNLVVSGIMTVNSGFVTHPQSRIMEEQHDKSWDWLGDLLANETYRLRLTVGSLRVGPSGVIDARGKGYWITNDLSRLSGCSHGGRMSPDSPPCYGDPREPIHIGMGYHERGNAFNGKGGGAIYIVASGEAVVDGIIRADAWDASTVNANASYAGAQGAAGSVFINADSITGTGSITAIGTGCSEEGLVFRDGDRRLTTDSNFKGTGGRVALRTRLPVDRSTFASISAQGNLLGAPNPNDRGWMANIAGGSGTVVFRDETRPDGLLVIAQQKSSHIPSWTEKNLFYRCPNVSADGDWTFDAIEFGYRGILCVPQGTELHLPNGFASCYSTAANADESGGIRYEGGVIDPGEGEQVFSGLWTFSPHSNYVFAADVVVSNGAAIGFHPVTDIVDSGEVPTSFPRSSFEVRGNLLVADDGAIRATNCGLVSTNGMPPSALGFHSHGGRSVAHGRDGNGNLHSKAFGSVFAPFMPGLTTGLGIGIGSTVKNQYSGGVVSLVVDGVFTLNGIADVGGLPSLSNGNNSQTGGAGGSLCVTAGRLAGTGEMRADGGNCGGYSGPGGRISVRLTDSDAAFSDFEGTIHAGGGSGCKISGEGMFNDASAGTVYLETASNGAGGGVVRIAMDPVNIGYIEERLAKGNAGNTNTTEMVSLGYGGDGLEAYRNVRYEISGYGRGAVNANFRARSVSVCDLDSVLDLEGNTLTVSEFICAVENGDDGVEMRRLPAGTYSAAGLAMNHGVTTVIDSSQSGTGRVVVRISGTQIILR